MKKNIINNYDKDGNLHGKQIISLPYYGNLYRWTSNFS